MTTFESLQGAESDFMVVLLGGFGLFWGSALLRVPRASQRLVAFLALHGGMVRRTAVAGSLWPDAAWLQPYSLFHYLQAKDVLVGDLPVTHVIVLGAVWVVGIIYALLVFPRRDIAAPS